MLALLLAAAAALAVPDDDLVPQSIEALLAQPTDPFAFGIPIGAPGSFVFGDGSPRTGWALADVGDVTGDGAPDLAVGYAASGVLPTLEVRDGRSGALVWSAMPGGGRGYRSLRALAARDGRVASGITTTGGLVEVRAAGDGAVAWAVPLAARAPVVVHAVAFIGPSPGDGAVAPADVLVAAGAGADRVARLDGVDGSVVWDHRAGDVAYDARPVGDRDGDGEPEVLAVGGDDAPFARLLSGADGSVLWSVPLPGPGAVALDVGDIDGDGEGDLLVGLFEAPGGTLVALSGADGAALWTCHSVTHDVTSLALLGDSDGDGLRDVAVGSFDNAANGVLVGQGLLEWRREVSVYNGGHVLSVAAAGDLDGDGSIDLFAGSFDHRVYTMGGVLGQFMSVMDARGRVVAVAALGDGDGDGRPETAAVGQRVLRVVDGASGTAVGPVILVEVSPGEVLLAVFAYPAQHLFVFAGLQTASIPVPGYGGVFGLDPAATILVHEGTAPGAGVTGLLLGPIPPGLGGTEVFVQAALQLAPGTGLLSAVESFVLVE